MKTISFLFIKTIELGKEGRWRCKIFFFSPSHRNSVTNYPSNSGFCEWGYLSFHSSESPQAGGSTELVQCLENVTNDPGFCPHYSNVQKQERVFFFFNFWFNVLFTFIFKLFFSLFFFLNPGEKSFLGSLSRLLLRFPDADLSSDSPRNQWCEWTKA